MRAHPHHDGAHDPTYGRRFRDGDHAPLGAHHHRDGAHDRKRC